MVRFSICAIAGIAALTCGAAVAETTKAARPVPRPALAERLKAGPEIIGIVHWGLNTFTDKEWGFGDADPKLLAPVSVRRYLADEELVKAILEAKADGRETDTAKWMQAGFENGAHL